MESMTEPQKEWVRSIPSWIYFVYGVAVDRGRVHVTMTLTAAGCPLHAVMADWVRRAAGRVPGVEHVDVTVTFEPPWTPERIRPRRPAPPMP